MSENLTLPMAFLITFCIVMEAISQLCFKQAANNATLAHIIIKPMAWIGILVWGIEVVAWLNVLEHVPLSVAYPMMSLTYVTRHAAGALLITAGVACVGVTGI